MASNLYFAYEAAALLFNTPLLLFTTSLAIRVKRASCRISKLPFIIGVVSLWWAVQYTMDIISNVNLQLYIHNLLTDPCFVQPAFLQQRVEYMTATCATMRALASDYNTTVQVGSLKCSVLSLKMRV